MQKHMILDGDDKKTGDDREVKGGVDPCYLWENLPHDVVMLIFEKLNFLDLVFLSLSCKSWHKVCLNVGAFSVLDFRNWTTILRFVGDRHLKIGCSSVTEDQVFNSVLKLTVKQSSGHETSIIFPNHQRVRDAINYVRQWCPKFKSFYLGEGGEYWHGRLPTSMEGLVHGKTLLNVWRLVLNQS